MGPVGADQLGGGALVRVGGHPGQLGGVGEDRIDRQHEAGELGRHVLARRGARVAVRVQEMLVVMLVASHVGSPVPPSGSSLPSTPGPPRLAGIATSRYSLGRRRMATLLWHLGKPPSVSASKTSASFRTSPARVRTR